jgi:hypothetical protein
MVWVEVPGTAGDPQPDDRPAGAGSASAAGATCAGGASDNAAVRVATTAPRRRANRHDWGLLIATTPNRVGTGGDSLRPNFEAPRHPQTAIYRSCRLQGPYVHDPDRGEAATFVPNALEASLRSTRSKHEHRHQYVDGRSPHHAMPSGGQLSSKSRPTLITYWVGTHNDSQRMPFRPFRTGVPCGERPEGVCAIPVASEGESPAIFCVGVLCVLSRWG